MSSRTLRMGLLLAAGIAGWATHPVYFTNVSTRPWYLLAEELLSDITVCAGTAQAQDVPAASRQVMITIPARSTISIEKAAGRSSCTVKFQLADHKLQVPDQALLVYIAFDGWTTPLFECVGSAVFNGVGMTGLQGNANTLMQIHAEDWNQIHGNDLEFVDEAAPAQAAVPEPALDHEAADDLIVMSSADFLD